MDLLRQAEDRASHEYLDPPDCHYRQTETCTSDREQPARFHDNELANRDQQGHRTASKKHKYITKNKYYIIWKSR